MSFTGTLTRKLGVSPIEGPRKAITLLDHLKQTIEG